MYPGDLVRSMGGGHTLVEIWHNPITGYGVFDLAPFGKKKITLRKSSKKNKQKFSMKYSSNLVVRASFLN
jgi:hypothetical protein